MPNAALGRAPFYLISPGTTDAAPTATGTGSYRGPFTFSGKNGNTLLNVRPAGSALAGMIAFRPQPMSFQVLLCNAVGSGNTADTCAPTTSGAATTVQFTTVNGVSDSVPHDPVKSGQDYVAACSVKNAPTAACSGPVSPPVTIPANEDSATVTVSLIPNMQQQNLTRHFTMKLLSAVNATVRVTSPLGRLSTTTRRIRRQLRRAACSGSTRLAPRSGATANAQGEPATAYIEYGTSAPAYGSQSASQALPVDFSDRQFTFSLTGLTPGTTYHYRVVATRARTAPRLTVTTRPSRRPRFRLRHRHHPRLHHHPHPRRLHRHRHRL